MSKRCGLCGTKYLNDAALDYYETNSSNDNVSSRTSESGDIIDDKTQTQRGPSQSELDAPMNKRQSVARILLAACDVCGLCGGKFND
jgi:hypothetical protein